MADGRSCMASSCDEAAGIRYAGLHVTIDFWGAEASALDDPEVVEEALRAAVLQCGATLLGIFVHRFLPHGVTGVAVLGESHMSIHAWSERRYAALDVFTCGPVDPYRALPVLLHTFQPERIQIAEQKRGLELR